MTERQFRYFSAALLLIPLALLTDAFIHPIPLNARELIASDIRELVYPLVCIPIILLFDLAWFHPQILRDEFGLFRHAAEKPVTAPEPVLPIETQKETEKREAPAPTAPLRPQSANRIQPLWIGAALLGCLIFFVPIILCGTGLSVLQNNNTPSVRISSTRPHADNSSNNDFINQLKPKWQDYNNVYHQFMKYSSQAAEDPSLLTDSKWKATMLVTLHMLSLMGKELAEFDTPPKFERTHLLFVQLQAETNAMVEAYSDGINNLDADSIYASTEHIKNIGEIVNQLTDEMQSSMK